jgi:DNA-binding response OmpR family regulator
MKLKNSGILKRKNKTRKGKEDKSKRAMKILIVEDEQVLSKVLKEKFEKAGFETKVSSDGEIAILDSKSFLPEIIVLDLVLPKKSGFEVLKAVKADPETKMIPVIVVSNLGEDSDIKQALNLGAKDYFVKSQHPINEIVEKVKVAITESR